MYKITLRQELPFCFRSLCSPPYVFALISIQKYTLILCLADNLGAARIYPLYSCYKYPVVLARV